MATHPDPSPNILLPFIGENIVQISRWWVANSILNNTVIIPTITDPIPVETYIPSSLNKTSNPSNLAPLNDTVNNCFPSVDETSQIELPLLVLTPPSTTDSSLQDDFDQKPIESHLLPIMPTVP